MFLPGFFDFYLDAFRARNLVSLPYNIYLFVPILFLYMCTTNGNMIFFNTRYTTRIDFANFKHTIFIYMYNMKNNVYRTSVSIRGIRHLIFYSSFTGYYAPVNI
jgi:hypothetical protein